MQTADSVKIFSVLSKRNAEGRYLSEDKMSTRRYFFRPDLNYYVMSPLVMNVTCKSRIWTNVLPCFAGAHAGTLPFALEHHKGSAEIPVYTNGRLCFSASPKCVQWEQTRI